MKVVVIGGGAAGLFTGLRCKESYPNSSVLILEKSAKLLSKVRISGGGRCNVTHHCFDLKKLTTHYPRGNKELLGPLHTFGPEDTVTWFAERGVQLKTESDGRMFPSTDNSQTIIDCLLNEAENLGVVIRTKQKIRSIEKGFIIATEQESYLADKLVLATGSAPWGHSMATQFGHSIIEPVPSLFTFNVPTSPLLDLSGISVPNATLSILGYQQTGPLLLTHWGFSGPAALKLSAWAARDLHAKNYKAPLQINWLSTKNLREMLISSRTCSSWLPAKLQKAFFGKYQGKTLSNKECAKIANKLENDIYNVEGKTTYKQEFVTAGGVNLCEIDFKTMESRLCKGLFFAGEILNIDGVTGGFNFQNAWTTAYLAGS